MYRFRNASSRLYIIVYKNIIKNKIYVLSILNNTGISWKPFKNTVNRRMPLFITHNH